MRIRVLLIGSICALGLATLSTVGALAQSRPQSGASVQATTQSSEFGYVLSPPYNQTPVITADEAISAARTAPLPTGAQDASAVLAHVLWKPGNIDQDAWVVTISGVCMPQSGPSLGSATRSPWAVGQDIFFIDASQGTGLFMAGKSDPSVDPASCNRDPTGNSLSR